MLRRNLLFEFLLSFSLLSILQASKLRPEGISTLPRIQKQESGRASSNKEDTRMFLTSVGAPLVGDICPIGECDLSIVSTQLSHFTDQKTDWASVSHQRLQSEDW